MISVLFSFPKSHSARGAWIETFLVFIILKRLMSHSARGAWIETLLARKIDRLLMVALREGCVDRNALVPLHYQVQSCRTPRGVRG